MQKRENKGCEEGTDEGEGGRKGKRQDEGKLAKRRTAVSRRKGR